jgi:hypothetical protein
MGSGCNEVRYKYAVFAHDLEMQLFLGTSILTPTLHTVGAFCDSSLLAATRVK